MDDALIHRSSGFRLARFVSILVPMIGTAVGNAAMAQTGNSTLASGVATLQLPRPARAPAAVDPGQATGSVLAGPPIRLASTQPATPSAARLTPTEQQPSNGRSQRTDHPVPSARLTAPSFTPRRLSEQAAQELAESEAALRRHAVYSAKASALESLRLVAEAKDYASGATQAAERLQAGLAAIEESRDFLGRQGAVDTARIEGLVASHRTNVLKGVTTDRLGPAYATDLYLNSARKDFAAVAAYSPVASRALFVLATIYRQASEFEPHADAAALNLLRAAVQSNPHDPMVANELGYLLMKQGILDEAQWALQQSLNVAPSVAAAHNLAEVMRQRGNMQGAAELLAQMNASPLFRETIQAGNRPPVVETLSPEQFAALSRPQQAFRNAAAVSAPAAAAETSARDRAQNRDASPPQLPPAAPPATGNRETPGPVGRVAQVFSGWFQ